MFTCVAKQNSGQIGSNTGYDVSQKCLRKIKWKHTNLAWNLSGGKEQKKLRLHNHFNVSPVFVWQKNQNYIVTSCHNKHKMFSTEK